MTKIDPAGRVLEAFGPLATEARAAVATALQAEAQPLLATLGLALTWPSTLAILVLDGALHDARRDGSEALVDQLGDAEPWLTLRGALIDALSAEAGIEIAADS
jgi:hypothetical protein